MDTTDKAPIVLIHGLWMTPTSWDTWAERFRAAGHEVIEPGWPGIDDRSVADIRSNPEPLEGIGQLRHHRRVVGTAHREQDDVDAVGVMSARDVGKLGDVGVLLVENVDRAVDL